MGRIFLATVTALIVLAAPLTGCNLRQDLEVDANQAENDDPNQVENNDEYCECDVVNGTGACNGDRCIIASCDAGYYSDDDDPATGCECGPDDRPDPNTFSDDNCDGIDGDASLAVFVATDGDDSAGGTRTSPVQTINRGIELALAQDSQRREVYIAEGVYHETVYLDEAVSLYGGYSRAGGGEWSRGHEFETVISGVEVEGGHRPVEIVGVADDVELQLLTIIAANASHEMVTINGEFIALPGTSVALTAVDAESTILLNQVSLEAGRGLRGEDGDDGLEGAFGVDGGDGEDFDFVTNDNPDAGVGGKAADIQSCQFSDSPAMAGDGGYGGYTTVDVFDGQDGLNADGGGAGGVGGQGTAVDGCGPIESNAPGEDGADGELPGEAGADSSKLAAGQLWFDEWDGDELVQHQDHRPGLFYIGTIYEPGLPGGPGASGGGGGGGGAGAANIMDCIYYIGAGGGAGGSGGCGGEPGFPGQFGGGSVGIMVRAASVEIVDSSIRTSVGGDGGHGGAGGDGGDGGSGGAGGAAQDPIDFFDDDVFRRARSGGDGGAGAEGGRGGDGAGGDGGPSVGIIYQDATVDVDDVDFDIGRGGEGGIGGGDAPDGADGVEAELHELSPPT